MPDRDMPVSSYAYKFGRLAEIKAWRARFEVHPDLVNVAREPAMGSEPESKVPVFQHTLEDYDFMLGLIEELAPGFKSRG